MRTQLTRKGAALFLVLLTTPDSPAAQTTGSGQPHSAGMARDLIDRADARPSTLEFLRKPRLRRVRNVVGLGLPESLRLEAVVRATARDGAPRGNVAMTLLARSDAGTFMTGSGVTGVDGLASLAIDFTIPPGSLGITVQSCLTNDASLCSEPVGLSTRDWASLDVGIDFTVLTALPTEDVAAVDVSFVTALSPKLQLHLWESEHRWRYNRLSAYATVPLVYRNRGIISPGLSSVTFGQAAGTGDVATGVSLNLRGVLLADIAYNGRNSKLNFVDGGRSVARPGLVSLGDGFESIDSVAQVNGFLGQRAFVFGTASHSRALPRRFADRRLITRDDAHQLAAGFGAIEPSRQHVVLIWAGRQRQGATSSSTDGRISSLAAADDRWLAGVTGFGFARRRVSGSGGFLVTWTDRRHVQLVGSGRVHLAIF